MSNAVRINFISRRIPSVKTLANSEPTRSHDPVGLHQRVDEASSKNTTPEDEVHQHQYDPRQASATNVGFHNLNDAEHPEQPKATKKPSTPYSDRRQDIDKTSKLEQIPMNNKWSIRKKFIVVTVSAIIVAGVIAAAVALAVKFTRSTGTTTASTATSTAPVVSVAWLFDNTTTEVNGIYNGIFVNGATYSPAANNQPYVGYGRALSLSSALNQSFLVSTPFLDLTFKSFTIEARIFLSAASTNDRGIFGQCQCSTCINQCLYWILRGSKLYIGFTSNDLTGSSTLAPTTWYHVAIVYNYQTRQQILYLNGIQDAINSNADPYQGTNGTIQIGSTQVFYTNNFFNGYIDNVEVVTRAKSAAEVLNDASLMAYYSFDLSNENTDNGPNGLDGTIVNAIPVLGCVNQALRFTGTLSYFQAYGFYQTAYGVFSGQPYSILLWVNPSSTSSAAFLQQSVNQTTAGTLCLNLMYLSQVGSWSQLMIETPAGSIYGSVIRSNVWTHIALTNGVTTGHSLYVNGSFFGSTGSSVTWAANQLTWLTIGSVFPCGWPASGNFQGSIDEVYLYNRELSAAEVFAIANL